MTRESLAGQGSNMIVTTTTPTHRAPLLIKLAPRPVLHRSILSRPPHLPLPSAIPEKCLFIPLILAFTSSVPVKFSLHLPSFIIPFMNPFTLSSLRPVLLIQGTINLLHSLPLGQPPRFLMSPLLLGPLYNFQLDFSPPCPPFRWAVQGAHLAI